MVIVCSTANLQKKVGDNTMGWKDDARLSVDLYGDVDNFIMLSINQCNESNVGNKFANTLGVGIEHATPELIGEAVAKYLRDNFWEEER